jgi:hypothetical protein
VIDDHLGLRAPRFTPGFRIAGFQPFIRHLFGLARAILPVFCDPR